MDAVEFIKTYSRMCHSFDRLNGEGANPCANCPLENIGNGCNMLDIADRADEAVSAVEQWAKELPVKTRQDKLLKVFPGARMVNGCVPLCPMNIDEEYQERSPCSYKFCDDCRRDFWLQEIE